ncbi:MAG: YdhR family protein [Ferruginibacter sp.]
MAQKFLITNFSYDMTREAYEDTVTQMAQQFADVPGLVWKIWLINADSNEAGAVYVFEDDAALQQFKASPLVAAVLSHPALSNFDLKERDTLPALNAITRAPELSLVG